MQEILDFLNDLHRNNNRPWFEQNKERYRRAQQSFNGFIQQLIYGIREFDPSIEGVEVKDCTYRIYRDIRFSHDKSPYKTHFGAFIAPGGRKGGYSGYYFHLEADGATYTGSHLIAAGSYCPPPKILESIRTDIFDRPQEFLTLLDTASGFSLDDEFRVKRLPKGFPADFEYADYLKYKDYTLYRTLSDEEVLSPGLLGNVLAECRKVQPYLAWINRATRYAYEEIM